MVWIIGPKLFSEEERQRIAVQARPLDLRMSSLEGALAGLEWRSAELKYDFDERIRAHLAQNNLSVSVEIREDPRLVGNDLIKELLLIHRRDGANLSKEHLETFAVWYQLYVHESIGLNSRGEEIMCEQGEVLYGLLKLTMADEIVKQDLTRVHMYVVDLRYENLVRVERDLSTNQVGSWDYTDIPRDEARTEEAKDLMLQRGREQNATVYLVSNPSAHIPGSDMMEYAYDNIKRRARKPVCIADPKGIFGLKAPDDFSH